VKDVEQVGDILAHPESIIEFDPTNLLQKYGNFSSNLKEDMEALFSDSTLNLKKTREYWQQMLSLLQSDQQ